MNSSVPSGHNLPRVISTPCLLHKTSVINKLAIKKCTIKWYNNTWYHVIYLSEPKDQESLSVDILKSVTFKHNESNKISEIWELLHAKPICSMNTLEHDCSLDVLDYLIFQLIKCICLLTQDEIIDETLISGSSDSAAKNFLTNIATVAENQGKLALFLLNRFTLKSIKHFSNKKKLGLLKKQLFMIQPLIKNFYFIKNSSKSVKNRSLLNNLCKDCTLIGYRVRYMHANIKELHNHFCTTTKSTDKMQGLLNMDLKIDILEKTIQFVAQLEANIRPIKP